MPAARQDQIPQEDRPSHALRETVFPYPGSDRLNWRGAAHARRWKKREGWLFPSKRSKGGYLTLHEQVRRRKLLATRQTGFDAGISVAEVEEGEQFVLDEVLQLVADRAVAITGADGLAIALADNNEIVLRAATGTVRPDLGARIDRDSAFSGACFRMTQIVSCDDTETDARVNLQKCRRLGARSMVA